MQARSRQRSNPSKGVARDQARLTPR